MKLTTADTAGRTDNDPVIWSCFLNPNSKSLQEHSNHFSLQLSGPLVFAAMALHLVLDGIYFIGTRAWHFGEIYCAAVLLRQQSGIHYRLGLSRHNLQHGGNSSSRNSRAQRSRPGVGGIISVCQLFQRTDTLGRELNERACCWEWTTNDRLHLQKPEGWKLQGVQPVMWARLGRGDTEQARFKYQCLAFPQKKKRSRWMCCRRSWCARAVHKAGGLFTQAHISEASGSQLVSNWTVGRAHPS